MGGGVMRTAAKVGMAGGAAAAAASGRFRSVAPAFATAAPAAESSAAPLVSAAGEVPAMAAAGPQWASSSSSWEVDDWEFADWRDVAVSEAEETAVGRPRLVFAPPSQEEAQEATTELREAIDRVYFNETPIEIVKEQDKELNKLGVDAIIPAMPGHVVQAFTLLKSSSEAQRCHPNDMYLNSELNAQSSLKICSVDSVVASLASDKNVWDAVLKNERVMEFYKNHQQTLVHTFPEDSGTVESPEKFEGASQEYASRGELPTTSPLSDFVDNAKKTVMEIVDNITHFFQDVFRNPAEAGDRPSSSTGKGSPPSFAEMAAGGSFMALAIAVILVVLFKRA
ncbi:hypothetical protein BRADI_3g15430v3 [Brachypodium distachyon]|uniref:Uncharacterized protein n=1 Tax=Brachypodium distachyon TaxID=15368 RepID=A0A0Q3FA76_BRADI|nr:hypothetical protein BRADI_3g15430v3 [Brachypodium distachyon]